MPGKKRTPSPTQLELFGRSPFAVGVRVACLDAPEDRGELVRVFPAGGLLVRFDGVRAFGSPAGCLLLCDPAEMTLEPSAEGA